MIHTDGFVLLLTLHTQRVVADGEASDFVRVKSGVPQGTVLGLLMFLLYINDISENLTSHTGVSDYLLIIVLCVEL